MKSIPNTKDKYQCPYCNKCGPNDVWLQWHWNFFHKKIDISEYDTNFGPPNEPATQAERKLLES